MTQDNWLARVEKRLDAIEKRLRGEIRPPEIEIWARAYSMGTNFATMAGYRDVRVDNALGYSREEIESRPLPFNADGSKGDRWLGPAVLLYKGPDPAFVQRGMERSL